MADHRHPAYGGTAGFRQRRKWLGKVLGKRSRVKMFHIYILENEKGKHYIGYTNDLEDRLRRHNTNQVKWTSKKGPWKIIYMESYDLKQDALKRERQIKKYKGGNAFKELLRRGARVVELARLATAVGGVLPEAAKARSYFYKANKERWPSG